MQEQSWSSSLRTSIALCLVFLVLAQQVCAGPVRSKSDQDRESLSDQSVKVLRRAARMTPLWRIMGTKPLGAYCRNNYECSTAYCSRKGHCTTSQPVKS